MRPWPLGAGGKQVSSLLNSLANPNRLMIACTLVEGEYSVG